MTIEARSGERHHVGGDGRCVVCGEVMPCATVRAAGATGATGTTSSSSCCKLIGLARAAYERTAGAGADREWGQLDALGAIVLAAAACEAFINELGEIARQVVEEDPKGSPAPPRTIAALADAIVTAERSERSDPVSKVLVAIEALTGRAPDTGNSLHENFKLLIRARNGLMHLKLEVKPAPEEGVSSSLPSVVKSLRSKGITGTEPGVPTGAVDSLTTRAVARWACNSAAAMLTEIIALIPDWGHPFFEAYKSQCARYFVQEASS